MASLSVPVANRRPLSTHGLPKPPRVTSPFQTHRFEGLGFSPQSLLLNVSSPRSPGPLSPPMSAKSFGTFIDSAPSTPAYSPRMEDNFDSSPLVMLRPLSTCSEPSSPTEPVWDMVLPPKAPQPAFHIDNSNFIRSHATTTDIAPSTTLSAPPIKRKRSSYTKPISHTRRTDPYVHEIHDPQTEEDKKEKDEAEPIAEASAPLGRLASKMRSMLRRKSTTDKKKEQKEKDYYDPIEEVHWTEM